MGNGCILPPGSVEGYPSPEEPPTPETSEDILHPGSLRANACGGPWKRLMLTTHLVMLSVCRDREADGGPQAKKGGNLRPSQVRGWRETRTSRGTSDSARLRNLRRGSVKRSMIVRTEELPEWPGRGTSGPARPRNLRHKSVGGSAIGRRIQASVQLKPPTGDKRRACNVKLRK